MGCSTSRLDHLPAVSLCHQRSKFLEDALYQSYALADAHLAYTRSLKTLASSLSRVFELDENVDDNNANHLSGSHSVAAEPKLSKSPDHYPSSSNSDSHLDFPSDESEDEDAKEQDVHLLSKIHTNYFERQTPIPSRTNSYSYRDHHVKYDYYYSNNGLNSTDGGGYAWKSPSPPPPPPPPGGSTWEFFNFFDPYERYEVQIKDKEGTLAAKEELENEIHGGEPANLSKVEKQIKVEVKKNEAQVVETKVVMEKEVKESTKTKNLSPMMVTKELEALFGRAAEVGNEVLKILDTGKFRYYHKNSIYQGVSSKMMNVVTSLSSSTEQIGKVHVGFDDEDMGVISVNLSSTLKKLCMWENKLYDEVKAEEKLQIMLVKSYRQIKNVGEKSAESNKVDSARSMIRALSTKIRVAIHVIDRTSITINKLRDEELWPLISEMVQKFLGMWKGLLDCHRCQSQTVVEAENLDAILTNGKFNEAHLEAAIHLKIELQNWNLSFSDWIAAQRNCVKSLNGWLLKCLPSEPEEMADETREPPLFAFCNQWSQAACRISEMEVINAIHKFYMNVSQLVERHYTHLQQRLIADKDLERRMKMLEKKERKIQGVFQSRRKKIFTPNGAQFSSEAVHQSEVTYTSSLHSGLKQIFAAIEKFSANNVLIYEELCLQIEDSKLIRANQ